MEVLYTTRWVKDWQGKWSRGLICLHCQSQLRIFPVVEQILTHNFPLMITFRPRDPPTG